MATAGTHSPQHESFSTDRRYAEESRLPSSSSSSNSGQNRTPPYSDSLKSSTLSRLETFADLQGLTLLMSVVEMAQNGFIFIKNNTIQCVWCNAIVNNCSQISTVDVLQSFHKSSCKSNSREGSQQRTDSDVEEDTDGPTSLEHGGGAVGRELGVARYSEVDLSSQHQDQARIASAAARNAATPRDLRVENERLKMQMTCRNCKQAPVETLFLPCRHLVSCEHCAELVDDCFLCHSKILGTVRTFLN